MAFQATFSTPDRQIGRLKARLPPRVIDAPLYLGRREIQRQALPDRDHFDRFPLWTDSHDHLVEGANHVGRRIDSSELQLALTCCLM